MKIDLLLCWLMMIAIVCGGVYAIIWQLLPMDVAMFASMLVMVAAGVLISAGRGEIVLRRHERFYNLRKMGFRETAYLIRQGWK